ncbi:hypothetical protein U27_00949 [Candidatus Vecturithrix granuli]|uniref:Uncharacterized protein n=1 Tax=Vecturithrix granuli TaxID=1499967 RepID=A0A081C8Z6_VECG1|nr:hypothetical protein U27_00949 [Candidatus Vecturithrix granuli]
MQDLSDIAKNKMSREPLPETFTTIAEAAAFWDTHRLADDEDLQQDVTFDVEIGRERNYFAIEKELSASIDHIASMQGVLAETLLRIG